MEPGADRHAADLHAADRHAADQHIEAVGTQPPLQEMGRLEMGRVAYMCQVLLVDRNERACTLQEMGRLEMGRVAYMCQVLLVDRNERACTPQNGKKWRGDAASICLPHLVLNDSTDGLSIDTSSQYNTHADITNAGGCRLKRNV